MKCRCPFCNTVQSDYSVSGIKMCEGCGHYFSISEHLVKEEPPKQETPKKFHCLICKQERSLYGLHLGYKPRDYWQWWCGTCRRPVIFLLQNGQESITLAPGTDPTEFTKQGYYVMRKRS